MSLPSGLLAVASSAVGLKSSGEERRMAGRDGGKDRKGKEGEIAAGPEHVYSHISVCLAHALFLNRVVCVALQRCFPATPTTALAMCSLY